MRAHEERSPYTDVAVLNIEVAMPAGPHSKEKQVQVAARVREIADAIERGKNPRDIRLYDRDTGKTCASVFVSRRRINP